MFPHFSLSQDASISGQVPSLPLDAGSSTQLPDNLSILPLDTTTATLAQDPNLSAPPQDTTMANLSIFPLDATGVSTSAPAADVSYQSLVTSGPGSLQTGLSKFHDIVCTLVRNYTTATAQVCMFA